MIEGTTTNSTVWGGVKPSLTYVKDREDEGKMWKQITGAMKTYDFKYKDTADLNKYTKRTTVSDDDEYVFGDGLTVTGKEMKIVMKMMLAKAKEECPEEFI